VDDLGQVGGGSAINRSSRKKGAFRWSVFECDTPSPPVDRNIFCVSDVFMLDTVRTSEMGGRGMVCQTDDVGQGGSKKSVFARTSLMDDPEQVHNKESGQ